MDGQIIVPLGDKHLKEALLRLDASDSFVKIVPRMIDCNVMRGAFSEISESASTDLS